MNFIYPGGTTVYIRESGGVKQFSTNQTSWTPITFPVNVSNSNTSLGLLIIEFITDITISSPSEYFDCASSHLQFGSSSLKNDGSRPVITVNASNYDGFIANGDFSFTGQSNIYVYNLVINGTGGSLQVGAGWLGKKGFGNSSSQNNIINCSTSGNINGTNSGGILGSYAGTGGGADVNIINCNSSGSIDNTCGGIVGGYAGYNGGDVFCRFCYSTGFIGQDAGGIFGQYAGYLAGSTVASGCYSTGYIFISAGGIYGRYAANTNGSATSINCYSTGNIDNNAGGIVGENANVSPASSTSVRNSYTTGFLLGPQSGGIFGNTIFGQAINCYAANGSWNQSTANTILTGTPTSSNVGSVWIRSAVNQPYELNEIGYTPYNTTNINTSGTPSLITSYNQNIFVGDSTVPAIVSGSSYTILDSYPNITINSSTGAISTTQNTTVGSYTIYIRNVQGTGYSITQFNLTVSSQQNNSSSWLLLFLLFRRYKRKRYPWLPIN